MLQQGVHDEAAVVRHITDDHLQQVIHLARQRGAFDHFGPCLHAFAERVHGAALVDASAFFQAHIEVGGQAQADLGRGDEGDVALDDAHILQALDAAQHGAGRQAHLLADHVVGLAAIFLQAAQDGAVEFVNIVQVGHGRFF